MPTKTQRCRVEIGVKSVTSPGTWLPKREDIYLSVSLFGHVRRTRAVACTFPLLFNDCLRFDKVFEAAYETTQVAEALEDFTVRINLIQLSEMFTDGRLLAYYESNARNFLYPHASRQSSYSLRDRELLLERTVAFPGINPRLEFSTRTVVEDTDRVQDTDLPITENGTYDFGYRATRRSRSRTRSPGQMPPYGRQTISSAVRFRSPSPIPSLSSQMKYLDFYDRDYYDSPVDDRPPFVVRKAEGDLIGRRPSSRSSYELPMDRIYRRSIPTVTMARTGVDPVRYYHSTNPGYMMSSYDTGRPCSAYAYDTRYDYSDPIGWDTEAAYQRRTASPSRYLSKLRDQYDLQFDDRYSSPQRRSARYRPRNNGRLYRNRSLDRLDRSRTYHQHMDSYLW